MDIKQTLLQDENFVKTALIELIKEEFKRVVKAGLISKEDFKNLIENHNLSEIYTKLSNIKIEGDKLNNDLKSEIKTEEEKTDEILEPVIKREQLVIDELEKIAYNIGKNGDHETAYIIERTIREIEKL